MSPRTVDRVDDWETVPFGGGYDGLRDLASQEFSGVVTAGPTRLFMIRGTVVGILDGSITDFEDSGGNAREAPHPALPLLAVMQERSDEVRAQYYTEDTALSDVDRTLEDGGFTGYVELSENVLSGDYYQVYHQGRSMSVAYVGSSERLITDDDAFEQANDEVGIYEVRPVDIDAIDIPDPADDAGGSTDRTGSDDTGSAGTDTDTRETASEDLSGIGLGDDGASSTESDSSEPVAAADPSEPDRDVGRSGETSAGSTDDTATTDTSAADTSAADTSTTGSVDFGPAAERTAPDSEPRQTGTDSHSEQSSSDNRSGSARTPEKTPDEETSASSRSSPDENTSASSRSSSSSTSSSGPETTVDEQSAEPREQAAASRDEPQSTPSDAGEPRQQDTPAATPDDRPSTGDQQPTDTGTGSQESDQRSSSPASTGTAADLEVRSIPSLDPSLTEAVDTMGTSDQSGGHGSGSTQSSDSPRSQQREQSSGQSQEPVSSQQTPDQSTTQPSTHQSSQTQPQQQAGNVDQEPSAGADQQTDAEETAKSTSASSEEVSRLESELQSREQRIEDLRTDLERVEAERDELETARADLAAERDRLQTELEESRTEIERLTERLEAASEGSTESDQTQISPGEAIDNTNLFVRYRSKGDATLETAHTGNADQSAVAENLRLEYHTQFDADTAAVGNESFDDYLTETIQYRFVDWLIGSLLYEIRDTGHTDGMADLYDALPKIDRAELNGQVSVNYTEDGEEHRSQERFDVVVRDRMGNPLVVANINDSRDPATDSMMTDLIKCAERVGESGETLAGAFLVTESFFEPGALETAEEATSSGLFSRDKRKSFVNLSRKGGYHLCLVEARNQEFHLAVPEL